MGKRAKCGLRVRRPGLLLFAYTALLLWDSTGLIRLGLLAAVLHEAGHAVVFRVLAGRWPRITLSLSGLCLSTGGSLPAPGHRLLLAAAGPAVNFLFSSGVLLGMQWGGYTYGGYWFAAANLITGLFNLLPVPGLDGAVVLGAAGDCLREKLQSCRK